jgi:hypothetical protein
MRKLGIGLAVALLAGLLAVALGASLFASGESKDPRPGTVVLVGRSVQGRQIKAVRLGERTSHRKVLVVGTIHGDEKAGLRVIRALREQWHGIRHVDLWTISTVNPDGVAHGTRQNARGVDLNRNFAYRWRPSARGSRYYGGPHPFSEREARVTRDLISQLRPDVTIWFHQPWDQVLAPCHGDARLERRYSRLSGIPLKRCRGQHLPGTATSWQEHNFPDTKAFVVELPGRGVTGAMVRRNARAVAMVAGGGAAPARLARLAHGVPPSLAALKPRIHDMLIPYGPKRKREMAHYSLHHYGQREWRLRRVEQIVEHLSLTPDLSSLYKTFAPDRPDVEYHELPGVCSHYGIGRSGRIVRFVPLGIRCRHTVGLNHLSVGIEHVGQTERDVLSNPRQLRASLRLTRWLRCRFHLRVPRVIGHAESLSSPFYKELDPRFRGRTHADWRHRYMQIYRSKLSHLGPCPKAGGGKSGSHTGPLP